MSPVTETPYLSVVATARNDDHGGNLLRRMQIFIDAWINQAKRHRLPCELILVEWNPPEERERLARALRWPRDTGPCQVRIIEVPAEIHARYRYASVLPLYQMIAKNVGIRRARGEFILATNIDIIFSGELMQFLAQRTLEKGRMYRIDRTDVMSDVPVDGTLEEQLAYCRSHVIRVCSREGTYALTQDGFRNNQPDDITAPDSGIHFGDGWFGVEQWESTERFRWIGNEAEVIIAKAPRHNGLLEIDVEVGPGADWNTPILDVLDDSGELIAECQIRGRSKFELVLPPPRSDGKQSFRLRARGGGLPVADDPRILTFRVLRCDWVRSEPREAPPTPAMAVVRESRHLLARLLAGWRASHGFTFRLLQAPTILRRAVRLLSRRGEDVFEGGMEFRMGRGWHELENTAGERFRWVSQDAQLAVRITDQRRSLALIVEPGPGIGFQPFHLLLQDPGGEVLGRVPVRGMTYADIALPLQPGTLITLVLTAEGGGTQGGEDPRQLNFRVYACGGGMRQGSAKPLESAPARFWMAREVGSTPSDPDWIEILEESRVPIADAGRQTFLHTNGCGDFTLMARENWHDLRGYPELDLFSMHLDSMLCCAAHHAGIREAIFAEPMRIYHVEHAIGSGWTPEGQQRLYERLVQKGIQCVSYDEVVWSITEMRRLAAPVIFNLDGWGCAETVLAEVSPAHVTQSSGTGC